MRPEDLARLAALEELHTEKAVSLAANWPGDEADAFHHAGIVLALRTVRAELHETYEQRHAMLRRAEAAEADMKAAEERAVQSAQEAWAKAKAAARGVAWPEQRDACVGPEWYQGADAACEAVYVASLSAE